MIRKYKFLFLSLMFLVTCVLLVTLFALLIKVSVLLAKLMVSILATLGLLLLCFWLCVGVLYVIWSLFYKTKFYSFYLWVSKK